MKNTLWMDIFTGNALAVILIIAFSIGSPALAANYTVNGETVHRLTGTTLSHYVNSF